MRNQGSPARLAFAVVCLCAGLSVSILCAEVKKPDLIVEAFTFSPANPTVLAELTFTGVVKNAGTAPAPASKAQFSLSTQLFDVPQLAPGAKHNVTLKIKLDKANNYGPTFIVDKSGVVNESSETNNSKQIYLTVKDVGTDLVVDSFTISPSSPTTTSEITFTGVIKNAGTSAAPPSKAQFSVSTQLFDVPRLEAGAQYKVTHRIKLDKAQNYGPTFTIDATNKVNESNETNNSKQIRFTVIEAKPNLRVVNFVVSPMTGTPATEITMTGMVENLSDVPAPASKAQFGTASEVYKVMDVPPLGPRGKYTVVHKQKLILGQHKIIFQVDCKNAIPELVENDNAPYQRLVTITQAK
ncbi:MAG: hypothetical protein KA419_16350 [Acidobacteria bacterium]|nr:hypothetical protein [Acidobacteriota bacterium]